MTGSRTLIVGDVHGCRKELEHLIAQSALRPEDDLVLVGDLVAKGPDSAGTVRLVRDWGGRAVRGNHDQKLIEWWQARSLGGPLPRLGDTHREAAESLPEQDWKWLAGLPYVLFLQACNGIVVHGGLVPGRPLEQQRPADMLNMRSIRPDGSISRRCEDGVPWASRWPGPERIFFGHDAVRGLQRYDRALGLDTGCVYGGRLTGYLWPEDELVSVAARAVWSSAGGTG